MECVEDACEQSRDGVPLMGVVEPDAVHLLTSVPVQKVRILNLELEIAQQVLHQILCNANPSPTQPHPWLAGWLDLGLDVAHPLIADTHLHFCGS